MTTRPSNAMLRGPTTVVYLADDLDAAKRWYSEVLGIEPCFSRLHHRAVERRTDRQPHRALGTKRLGPL